MIHYQDLLDNFIDVSDLGSGVYKFKVVTQKLTYFYYLKLSTFSLNDDDLLIVSENRDDSKFALMIFNIISSISTISKPTLFPLPSNEYGFSNLFLVPTDYHSYFKGILDDKRNSLVLCLPIHRCEFSGNEPIQEFFLMRRETVSTLDWKRPISPKIILRFDNPKTGSGTGNSDVLVKYNTLLNEINNLEGVIDGYIEIKNYKSSVIEILSPYFNNFILIRERNDQIRESLNKSDLLNQISIFLTE